MAQPVKDTDKGVISRNGVAYLLATGFGAGLIPVAPGTFGALEGVALFFALRRLNAEPATAVVIFAVANVVLFIVGVWASSRTCETTGLKDPGQIVIDEMSGQLI